ncbi:MAG: DUF4097 family beta strand repeat protein [Clostridia bacterium]|nr:DUF4097 family beta strand repeat protein [Clostridia bacterium]
MYQKVTQIIDILFQDIEMTEEAQALKEELTADLNERYADLIASGLDESEAARRIQEDLDGFGELTSQFPRRQTSATEEKAASLVGITRISTSVGQADLLVIPSEDSLIHWELAGDDLAQWRCERRGEELVLEIVWPEDHESDMFSKGPEDDNLAGWLLRMINKIAAHVEIRRNCRGTIRLPSDWRGMMDVTSGSGDVSLSVPLEAFSIRTGSGNAEVTACEGCRSAHISTASGDVKLTGDADSAVVSTTSGDIDLSGAYPELRVSATSGDARLIISRTDSLKMQTTSGDIDVSGEAKDIGFNTVSGDVTLSLSGKVTRIKGNAVSGDTQITLTDGQPAEVRTHTVSGSLRVNSQSGPDAADIELTSVSGDIDVE